MQRDGLKWLVSICVSKVVSLGGIPVIEVRGELHPANTKDVLRYIYVPRQEMGAAPVRRRDRSPLKFTIVYNRRHSTLVPTCHMATFIRREILPSFWDYLLFMGC